MKLLRLASKSAWNRRASLLLTILSIAISVALLLGVDKIRKDAKSTFVNTISGTDLIVGARSGPINLLLYSVFHIGNATSNVSWKSYLSYRDNPKVAWTVPMSLGDSHRGFRVVGTSDALFSHYQYGKDQSLQFAEGKPFEGVYDAVLGAEVAESLGYQLDQKMVLSHGLVSTKFAEHDDKPFSVTGILKRTGTPLDRSVFVSLAGIEAIHVDWQLGTRSALRLNAEQALKADLTPKSITAFMLGLKSRLQTFRLQRAINDNQSEAMLAIIPGATLAELWRMLSSFETILVVISVFVLVTGLVGMLTTLLSSLNERRREMAVLRAVGAHPSHILMLFVIEALMITVLSCLLGVALLYGLLWVLKPLLLEWYGLVLPLSPLDAQQLLILGGAIVVAMLCSLVPGFIAFRRSLQDGLMVKL